MSIMDLDTPIYRHLLAAAVILLFTLTTADAQAQTGALDVTFGTDGTVVQHLEGTDEARGALIQEDGRIVVFGEAENACGILRLDADGTLDATFGENGMTVVEWVGMLKCSNARGGLLLEDGRIVVLGTGGSKTLVLIRLTSSGELDTSFGTDGLVDTDLSGQDVVGYSIVQQPDGKLVVVGSLGSRGGEGVAIARYGADGTLDTSFATDGVLTIENNSAMARAAALQTDGKIVVAGERNLNLAAWRFTPEGNLDASFGTDGVVELEDTRSGADLAIVSSGQIVVSGTDGDDRAPKAALFRLQEDGTLDTDFGSDGIAIAAPPSANASYGRAIAVSPEGRLVLAGQAHPTVATSDFLTARFDGDGQIDASFGVDGIVVTDLGHDYREWANAASVQADGKIVVVGQTFGDGFDFAVLRYEHSEQSTAAGQEHVPSVFALGDNYPNPFNPTTTVPFVLAETGDVRVSVYDVLGRRVVSVDRGTLAAGSYQQRLDMRGVAGGVYFYEIRVNGERTTRFRSVKKLILMK